MAQTKDESKRRGMRTSRRYHSANPAPLPTLANAFAGICDLAVAQTLKRPGKLCLTRSPLSTLTRAHCAIQDFPKLSYINSATCM